jgi:pSer/pThr/pTyr-binding forkhead associated (FHA) protein
MPFGPAGVEAPQGPADRTMLVGERPATAVFAWLVVFDGPDRRSIGKVYILQPDMTTLGRVQGNDVVINDDACSSQHARIRIEAREGAEPAFVLFDLGSRNGTYVGDRESHKNPESQKYRHELRDGDFVLVGDTTLVFKKV